MNFVTPIGFRDILSDEAAERERITRAVQDLFARHGFMPIETPTLEVMDVLNTGAKLPASPFKFFDSQGDLLAMRPDVTLQVSRMCATRLMNTEGPYRFRYTQRVFRESEGEAQIMPREITQMGVECIGQSDEAVDAEIVSLFVRALKSAGVSDICLAIATVTPLRSLLERSGADAAWKQAVLDACHNSDFVELDRLTDLPACTAFDTSRIAPAYADAIRELPRIRGGKDALARALDLVAPLGCQGGIAHLEEVCDALTADDPDVDILVDFSVMSSFDYYTGIVFEAYSPYLGTSLGGGGRYDNMLSAFGRDLPAAGFAFGLEQAMAANAEEGRADAGVRAPRKLRIAVPKGALAKEAALCLSRAGLDTEALASIGRQLVISTPEVDFIIVRPSDAPAFVAQGAADCGICGRDSLLESGAQVVELDDLKFGACRFVVAEPIGAEKDIEERYRKLGSIRVATKYPHITLAHYAKTGVQVEILKLHGNIELAPLTGLAERIVDITATGTTLRENNLRIVEEVLSSTARFFANPCSLRTNPQVIALAQKLKGAVEELSFEPIAGEAM